MDTDTADTDTVITEESVPLNPKLTVTTAVDTDTTVDTVDTADTVMAVIMVEFLKDQVTRNLSPIWLQKNTQL